MRIDELIWKRCPLATCSKYSLKIVGVVRSIATKQNKSSVSLFQVYSLNWFQPKDTMICPLMVIMYTQHRFGLTQSTFILVSLGNEFGNYTYLVVVPTTYIQLFLNTKKHQHSLNGAVYINFILQLIRFFSANVCCNFNQLLLPKMQYEANIQHAGQSLSSRTLTIVNLLKTMCGNTVWQ